MKGDYGSDDVNRINAQMRVIAILMPNTNATEEEAWEAAGSASMK
ncbi:hypothetical protein [Spirosoma endophyticum]|nr:hypothetical protein [Spirosoma endophyticum]